MIHDISSLHMAYLVQCSDVHLLYDGVPRVLGHRRPLRSLYLYHSPQEVHHPVRAPQELRPLYGQRVLQREQRRLHFLLSLHRAPLEVLSELVGSLCSIEIEVGSAIKIVTCCSRTVHFKINIIFEITCIFSQTEVGICPRCRSRAMLATLARQIRNLPMLDSRHASEKWIVLRVLFQS